MEKTLLKNFLGLYTLSNDTSKWSAANFAKNPPRLYRLQMIAAVLKALKIEGSYQEFEYGQFLYDEGRQDLAGFKTRVEENYSTIFETINLEDEENSDFQFIFEVLLRYRIKLHQFISVKATVLEAAGINKIPLTIMSEIENKLQNDIAAIDNILCYLLNPKGMAYSIEELKTKFNYPNVDLDKIDSDWI
jgi:hypothetical protein